ncbi:MAG TPA: sulfite exporter TauE/SafE family protein [Pyrinomonadaceae bacterium]|nr:sulfite exporter TauE/SafE family protein [Pyrinomonadaceae bacterium]
MGLQFITGLILSAGIGLSLGLIGGGGSIITVPVLVYTLNVEAHEAVGMSLAVVGATSLVGAFLHWRRGSFQLKTGLLFGAAGIFGALAGSPLTHLLSPAELLLTFAGLMLVVAILMLRKKPVVEIENVSGNLPNLWKALAAGFGVGVLTGFLGVGGGFLIVPALIMFGGLSMKESIGTSLLVIFLNCVAGLAGHASQSHFDWSLTGLVTILAVSGTIAGALLSHRLAAQRLQKVFSVFVFAVALFLIAKNYTVLL